MNITPINKLPVPVMTYILSFLDSKDKNLRTVSQFFKKCFDKLCNLELTNIEKNNKENPKIIEIISNIRKKNPTSGDFIWFQMFSKFNDNKFLKLFVPLYKQNLGHKHTLISEYQLDTLEAMENLEIEGGGIRSKKNDAKIMTIVKSETPNTENIRKTILMGHKLKLFSGLPKILFFSSQDLLSFPIPVINLYVKLFFVSKKGYGIEKLLLPNNKIFFIPREIGLLDNQLTVIDLSDNNLSYIPKEIGNLCKLKILNISGNKIKHLPETMKKLKTLKQLNVQRNPLNESSETVIELKAKLKERMFLPSEFKDDNK